MCNLPCSAYSFIQDYFHTILRGVCRASRKTNKWMRLGVTCVRESLGGITGVGGDPDHVPCPLLGSFIWLLELFSMGLCPWRTVCQSILYFVILFIFFSVLFFFVYCTSVCVLVLFYCISHSNLLYCQILKRKRPLIKPFSGLILEPYTNFFSGQRLICLILYFCKYLVLKYILLLIILYVYVS